MKGRQLTAQHYALLAAVLGGEAQRQLPNYHVVYAVNAATSGPLVEHENNTEGKESIMRPISLAQQLAKYNVHIHRSLKRSKSS